MNSHMNQAEMSKEDHLLLIAALREKKPKKIVEIGVSAGATTCLILQELSADATLYSNDIEAKYYKNATLNTAYLAEEFYDASKHAHWVKLFGTDISFCLDSIGTDIDFVILDTMHVLPGEFLSFLAIFPFMQEDSVLMLHDIGLVSVYVDQATDTAQLPEFCKNAYCTTLLFNAIFSKNKQMAHAKIPNAGIIKLDKQYVMDNIFSVISMLFIKWHSPPPANILIKTLSLVRTYYPAHQAELFEKAIRYNLAENGLALPAHI